MTSPDALAILAKPEHERIAAVADLLRERNSLLEALRNRSLARLEVACGLPEPRPPAADGPDRRLRTFDAVEKVLAERNDLRARLAPVLALDLDAPRCRQCWTIPQVVEHSLDSDPFQPGVLNYWPGGWRLDCPVCGLDVGGPETTWPATLRDRLPEPVLAAIVAAQGVTRG